MRYCSILNIFYVNLVLLIYSKIFQHPESILRYCSTLNIFCDVPAPWIYFVLFQHPDNVLWNSSPWIFFTILKHPQNIFYYSSTLNILCVIPAPWSTWNCSFSGLLSWLPTTCWNSDLSTSGELVPKSSINSFRFFTNPHWKKVKVQKVLHVA